MGHSIPALLGSVNLRKQRTHRIVEIILGHYLYLDFWRGNQNSPIKVRCPSLHLLSNSNSGPQEKMSYSSMLFVFLNSVGDTPLYLRKALVKE